MGFQTCNIPTSFLLSVAPLGAGWDFPRNSFNLVPTSEVQVIFAFTEGVGTLLRDSDHFQKVLLSLLVREG